MRGPHNIWRLIRTGATLERTGAMGVVLDAFDAPAHLRLTAHILGWPFKWLGLKGDLNMPPAPRALTALGPAYIKFGQVLSTRPDVVGNELASQLTVLQDKLPPFSTEIAKQNIAHELGAAAVHSTHPAEAVRIEAHGLQVSAMARGSARRCPPTRQVPGFSPALLRGGAGLRAALALQAVGLCATSSTSHHEASKLMRLSPNYWQTCARRRIRVSALHRSHASPSPLSRHGPHREHGCHH